MNFLWRSYALSPRMCDWYCIFLSSLSTMADLSRPSDAIALAPPLDFSGGSARNALRAPAPAAAQHH
uniref:Csu622 n=1 Tax=Arundo donax TaxID=35708 RepID=A0A0A8ZRJ7_ARUDO